MAASRPIAFVCAMPSEAKPLARRLGLHRSIVAGMPRYTGSIGERSVVLLVCGIGTEPAATATRQLLDEHDIERVVVVGITGAVDDETPIGTLVRPEVVIDAATGERFTPHPLGDAAPNGAMWTTDTLITTIDELVALRGLGVVALDMETAAIGRECEIRDIAWSVVRAISDRATDGSVDEAVFGLTRQDGTPNAPAIARYLITRPHRVPGLMRLAKGSATASEAAAREAARAWTAFDAS